MKILRYGIIHAFAQCQNCDWDSSIDISCNNRMDKLRKQIKNHVRKYEHTVVLETGNSTKYSHEI